ncbi:unnamed protein product [Adineta ricciae]|nr:unnamed protein product [Adineta ricciae]
MRRQQKKISVQRRSCNEDLANELWLEMFEYFDYVDLLKAFFGLNRRTNQLIQSIKILLLRSSYVLRHPNRSTDHVQ